MVMCVLTIAGSDPSGGAGIQNDLKTIAAHGMHGASCITVVTIQNSRGIILPSLFLDSEVVKNQIMAVCQDLPISSIKVGLLGNREISTAVSDALGDVRELPIVMDPIIWTGTGDLLLSGDPIEVLRPMMGLATVITPNVAEAEALSGVSIGSPDQAEKAARKIISMGPESVIVKGGHLEENPFTDVLVTQRATKAIPGNMVKSKNTHGSGCTFSSSLACHLARGVGIEEAAVLAKRFTEKAIMEGFPLGEENGPVDPLGRTVKESRSLLITEAMARAVRNLEDAPLLSNLIPQVGINIAMAPSGAKDVGDVIGLTGRIIRVGGRPRACGYPARGGSSHMARMALALRLRTGELGCCMNIKYSEDVLKAGESLGLTIAGFDRRDEPEDEKTMEWGLARALGSSEDIPDLVYDRGAHGKEAMIRILGSDPEEVAEKAIRIAGALR